jgi:hypothetical protein
MDRFPKLVVLLNVHDKTIRRYQLIVIILWSFIPKLLSLNQIKNYEKRYIVSEMITVSEVLHVRVLNKMPCTCISLPVDVRCKLFCGMETNLLKLIRNKERKLFIAGNRLPNLKACRIY